MAKGRRWPKGGRAAPPAPPPPPPPAPPATKLYPPKTSNEKFDLEALAQAAVASVLQPAQLKLCRLCETKDGPFLNIFGAETGLAKKIDELLPVVIEEYDELPHKICFRCSAKVEELHEFAQKCIKAQKNLRKNMGKGEITLKNIKGSKMSNDYYSELAIKKAMEFFPFANGEAPPEKTAIPTQPTAPSPQPSTASQQKKPTRTQQASPKDEPEQIPIDEDNESSPSVKQVKVVLDRVQKEKPEKNKVEEKLERTPTRLTRSAPIEPLLEGLVVDKPPKPEIAKVENKVATPEPKNVQVPIKDSVNKKNSKKSKKEKTVQNQEEVQIPIGKEINPPMIANKVEAPKKAINKELIGATVNPIVVDDDDDDDIGKQKQENEIMQHVSTIKVGGAGYLFQCKLCKRNFLKKEVVLAHSCAKNFVSKPPPKLDVSKPVLVPKGPPKPSPSDKDIIQAFKNRTAIDILPVESPPATSKPKPGPASRKRALQVPSPVIQSTASLQHHNPIPPSVQPPILPSVEVPNTFPGTKGRYKLVPGPNNTFTLVEDTTATVETMVQPQLATNNLKRKSNDNFPQLSVKWPENADHNAVRSKINMNNKSNAEDNAMIHKLVPQNQPYMTPWFSQNTMENHITPNYAPQPPQTHTFQNDNQPYPVGLFQTIPRGPITAPPAPIPTPAMKKQSYTVVPSNNPSKLVLSTKPPAPEAPPPPTAVKAKKGKKPKKAETKTPEVQKQPFSVEDSAPPADTNEGFFTFINVDPLLQPSYVLPTNNIIQESQITTSTPTNSTKPKPTNARDTQEKDLYKCELCQMVFTREKKLLTHIQLHYAKSEEDDDFGPSTARKRGRKS